MTINDTPVTITSGSFNQAVTLVNGANTITVIATDTLGNSAYSSRTVTLDQAAPTLAVTAPVDTGKTAQQLATIAGSVNETATVTIALNSGTAQNAAMTGNSFSLTVSLAAGLNTVTIIATDLGGKKTTTVRTVTYDSTAPSLAITNPDQDITTEQNSIVLAGRVSDALTAATVTVTFNGQTYTPAVTSGDFSQSIVFTTEKTYPVTVTAADEAGNRTSVQRNIIYAVPVRGDVNNNGTTDLVDVLKVFHHAFGSARLTAAELVRADIAPIVNGVSQPDGKVDIHDVIVILRRAVGLPL
jgi:hypothetical protein